MTNYLVQVKILDIYVYTSCSWLLSFEGFTPQDIPEFALAQASQ